MKNALPSLMLLFVPALAMAGGWTRSESGKSTSLLGAYFDGAQHGYVVGDDNVILETADGGDSWTGLPIDETVLGPGNQFEKVRFFGDTGYVVRNNLWMLVSTDKGATWKTTAGTNAGTVAYEFAFIDSKTFVGVGNAGKIDKSEDGGKTWTHPVSGGTRDLKGVDFVDEDIGYAVGGKSAIYKTEDGGETWDSLTATGVASYQSVDFTDADHGCAAGQGIISRTTDGGATWSDAEWDADDEVRFASWKSIRFASPSVGYAVGHNGAIAKTTDGGATWSGQESGTLTRLMTVFPVDGNTVYAVGDSGVILATTDGGGEAVAIAPRPRSRMQAVPMEGGIRITLPRPERITLRRTDLLGNLISLESLRLAGGEQGIPLRKHRGLTVLRIQGSSLSRSFLIPGL